MQKRGELSEKYFQIGKWGWDLKWKDWTLLGDQMDDLPIINGQQSECVN